MRSCQSSTLGNTSELLDTALMNRSVRLQGFAISFEAFFGPSPNLCSSKPILAMSLSLRKLLLVETFRALNAQSDTGFQGINIPMLSQLPDDITSTWNSHNWVNPAHRAHILYLAGRNFLLMFNMSSLGRSTQGTFHNHVGVSANCWKKE